MKKILIVDDFKIIVDMLCEILSEEYECICGYSANDIVKYKDEVDLIVSDYGMFWINEDKCDDFVWSTQYLKDIDKPKILITGVDPDDGYNNIQEDKFHVDVVLFKPIDIDELQSHIKKLLEEVNG